MSLSISMFTIAFCKQSAILKFKTLNAQVFRYIRWINNKKIVTPVKGSNVDTFTLSVLLSHIAIKLQKDKFKEICEVLKNNGSLSSQVETPPSSPNAHGRKRRFNESSAKDLVLDFDRFSA